MKQVKEDIQELKQKFRATGTYESNNERKSTVNVDGIQCEFVLSYETIGNLLGGTLHSRMNKRMFVF